MHLVVFKSIPNSSSFYCIILLEELRIDLKTTGREKSAVDYTSKDKRNKAYKRSQNNNDEDEVRKDPEQL